MTIAGRHWPIGGLESLDPHDRSYAERLARRATHEGSVADVSRRGAARRRSRARAASGLGAVPLVQILDEVLFEVPEAELAVAARVAADAMRHAFELEVPLVVGVEAGPELGRPRAGPPRRRPGMNTILRLQVPQYVVNGTRGEPRRGDRRVRIFGDRPGPPVRHG